MPLTASQIVADALTISKVPAYTALGGRQLNLVLNDLAMHRNLKVNLSSSVLNLSAFSNGPFNLESDYKRSYDVFYFIDGTPMFLNPATLKEYDTDNLQQNLSDYPYEYATDLSPVGDGNPGLIYIYPQANTSLVLTHRYFKQRPDIVSPESSNTQPWFEDQDYLIEATSARIMRITDDSRYESFLANAERMLAQHLLTEGDEQQIVKEVQLDPRRFKMRGASKPTKLDPW